MKTRASNSTGTSLIVCSAAITVTLITTFTLQISCLGEKNPYRWTLLFVLLYHYNRPLKPSSRWKSILGLIKLHLPFQFKSRVPQFYPNQDEPQDHSDRSACRLPGTVSRIELSTWTTAWRGHAPWVWKAPQRIPLVPTGGWLYVSLILSIWQEESHTRRADLLPGT